MKVDDLLPVFLLLNTATEMNPLRFPETVAFGTQLLSTPLNTSGVGG